jgi:putative oxidoreductase
MHEPTAPLHGSWLQSLFGFADQLGSWLPALVLRLLLAWEFWEAGVEKLHGSNWFADIQDNFPFPFSVLPVELSWQMATWSEVLGALLLVVGLATRFAGISLIVLTIVAWIAVHAGNGYNVCDNGWKLPLIYLVMFVPLVLQGPGRLSLDHLIARRLGRRSLAD